MGGCPMALRVLEVVFMSLLLLHHLNPLLLPLESVICAHMQWFLGVDFCQDPVSYSRRRLLNGQMLLFVSLRVDQSQLQIVLLQAIT